MEARSGPRREALMKRLIAVAIVAGLATTAASARAAAREPERFSAYAVNLEGPYGATTSLVNISINRWSTDAERKALESVFEEKGPDALLVAMQKAKPVGRIHSP